MAETDSHDEPTLLAKRKADDEREKETHPLKSQKLEAEPDQENQNHANQNHDLEDSNHANHEARLPADGPNGGETTAIDADEEDDSESEEDEEEEGAPVDRKGKGVLIEEEEEDSDDDSSDGGVESGADSDLSEDPLTEVDLDNILPSRTRRRVVQPGVYIANDVAGNDDDSDSDA